MAMPPPASQQPCVRLRLASPAPHPTRPALVFLPGTDGTAHGLATQITSLDGAGWEVWAATYDADDTGWGWAAAVAAVRAAIAGNLRAGDRARPVLVVGESFGACLALRLAVTTTTTSTAAAAPAPADRPTGLALINPATAFPRALGGLPSLIAASGLLAAAPDAAYGLAQRILLPLLVDRGRTGPGGEAAAARMMGMEGAGGGGGGGGDSAGPARPAAAAAHRLRLMNEGAGLDDAALAAIALPTALIASAGDALLPSLSETARLLTVLQAGRQGRASSPTVRRLILPESGHAPLLESGVDLAALLARGGVGPADLAPKPSTEPAIPFTAPPQSPPPWAVPDPAVDAALESLSPLRALLRPTLAGAANLPDPTDPAVASRPILIVANHSLYGLYDLPFLVGELYARGLRVRGVAHPAHWRGPLGPVFESLGAIKSYPRTVLQTLQAGEACLLFPGGGREVTKRAGDAYTLAWREAPDAVRLAAKAGAVIIPLASVGADDAYDVLVDTDDILASPIAGPAVRAALGALLPGGGGLEPEEAVFPISALPLPGPLKIPTLLPIPLPNRLYFSVGKPVDAAAEVEAAGGGVEGARVVYARVRADLEAAIAAQLADRETDADGLRSLDARVGALRARWLGRRGA